MERCDLLNKYDTDGDGTMDMGETMSGVRDYTAGTITEEEVGAIVGAWELGEGGVGQLCPRIPRILMVAVAGIVVLYLLTR